jgi:two-component system phosphate regulon response regulator OmpR
MDASSDKSHILVVDDDTRLRELLKNFLSRNDFRVSTAASAAEARQRLGSFDFDLIVLDVMMPGETGLAFATELRRTNDVPILMLTAMVDTKDRIAGLETGVDDYLGKPFEPRELLLRINNILRRGMKPSAPLIEQVRFGPFTFHRGRRELSRGLEQIHLTDREREIMAIFAATPGDTVPRTALMGGDGSGGERTVDVQINRLRRKIEVDPANPVYLQTVRGIGYRLAIAS